MAAAISSRDYQALYEFRQSIRRFLHFSSETARAVGIEPQQHQLLLAVKSAPGSVAEIGEVAERLQIRHHSAVELLNRTAEAGLIVRRRSETDRRHVCVRLTPAGEAVLRRLSESHRQELQRGGPQLIAALETAVGRQLEAVAATAHQAAAAGE